VLIFKASHFITPYQPSPEAEAQLPSAEPRSHFILLSKKQLLQYIVVFETSVLFITDMKI